MFERLVSYIRESKLVHSQALMKRKCQYGMMVAIWDYMII